MEQEATVKQPLPITPGQYINAVKDVFGSIYDNSASGLHPLDMDRKSQDYTAERAAQIVDQFIDHMKTTYHWQPERKKDASPKVDIPIPNYLKDFDWSQYPEGARWTDIENYIKQSGATSSNRNISKYLKTYDGIYFKRDAAKKRYFPV